MDRSRGAHLDLCHQRRPAKSHKQNSLDVACAEQGRTDEGLSGGRMLVSWGGYGSNFQSPYAALAPCCLAVGERVPGESQGPGFTEIMIPTPISLISSTD